MMDTREDRLILLLRDLHSVRSLGRDNDPSSVAPRSLSGGSPLAAMISSRSNAADDASDAQTSHLWHFIYTGESKNAKRVRAALLHRIAEESLPGDPAAEYDPARARVAHERLRDAPEPIRSVLRTLRHVPTPYDPWESVCVRLAESLAPDDLRLAWAPRKGAKGSAGRPPVAAEVPTPAVWGEYVLLDALRWWETCDGIRKVA